MTKRQRQLTAVSRQINVTNQLCFSVDEAATILGVGKSHLKKFVDSGELRASSLAAEEW